MRKKLVRRDKIRKETIRDHIREKRKEKKRKKIEKEKLKRRSRRFGFAPVKHAKKGLESCFLAGLTLFFMVLIFSVSYVNKGKISLWMGFLGILMLATSGLGIWRAVLGFRERDRDYGCCKIGMASCIVLTISWIMIFLRGLI